MSYYATNTTFDPFNQVFTVLAPDGITPIYVPLNFTHGLQRNTVSAATWQGSQIGAATLLLACLCLLTKTDKRRSLVFILNALALFLVILRGIFYCIVLNGPFYSWYRYMANYYADVGEAQAVSSTCEVVTSLLVAVIEFSLVMQVRIVCCTLEPRWRYVVNALNMFVALCGVGARFALMVLNIDWDILHIATETVWQHNRVGTLAATCNILLTTSIGISSLTFCSKLAFAIKRRRSMGMTQFGPMQIIFVMGCQTMFAPLLFTIITYFAVKNVQLQSMVPTVVALLLPLSAMWAAANANNVHVANPDAHQHHPRISPVSRPDLASGKAYGTTTSDMSDTLIDDESVTAMSPMAKREAELGDLEMGRFGGGGSVFVDRSYSVRSD